MMMIQFVLILANRHMQDLTSCLHVETKAKHKQTLSIQYDTGPPRGGQGGGNLLRGPNLLGVPV